MAPVLSRAEGETQEQFWRKIVDWEPISIDWLVGFRRAGLTVQRSP